MISAHQPKRPTQRLSSGKDIFSRMLQLEKQSRHQRTSSTSPVPHPLSPRTDYPSSSTTLVSLSPSRSPRLPLATPPPPPLHSSYALESHKSPVLVSTVHPSEKTQIVEKTIPIPLTLSTDLTPEEKPIDICLSPSWSDHGEKARKKEKRKVEKEQKERAKRLRQEEERRNAADVKAGKRLSKRPPPAAMETQKMPTSLRRNSWVSFMSSQSSSGENTMRSSRDEKRLSGVSLDSTKSKRSQSTPGTSNESAPATARASEPWKPIVSSSAPKLPSFRWSSSRRNSYDHGKSTSSGGDYAYENDLIAFAYRLETSEVKSKEEEIGPDKILQISNAKPHRSPAPNAEALNHSATEPSFKSIPYESVSSRSPQRSPAKTITECKSKLAKGHDRSQSEQSSNESSANRALSSPRSQPQSPTKSLHDGSSYVHKQRMYQQQQSIAGFEDQQAIQDATEAAIELAADSETQMQALKTTVDRGRHPGPGTLINNAQPKASQNAHSKDPAISSVYTKQRGRSTSPRAQSTPAKRQPAPPTSSSQDLRSKPKIPVEANQALSQKAGGPENPSKNQGSASSKSDRILGFRRRTKQPPALISIPYQPENKVITIQSAPLDKTTDEDQSVKRSKIEQLFKEPKPAFANRHRRSSSSSSKSIIKQESLETKPLQSHSRTRTSSPTALNDSILFSLPKSATEPVLNRTERPLEQTKRTKSDYNDQGKMLSKSRSNPPTLPVPQSDIAQEIKSSSGRTIGDKTRTKDSTKADSTSRDAIQINASKKQTHEVIVESETGEGLTRKTSIKRPRSNPQFQSPQAALDPPTSLNFLPPLKHEPLVKKERQSPTRTAPDDKNPMSVSTSQFQEPVAALTYQSPIPPDLKLIPRSPLRPPPQFPVPATNRTNRSSTEVSNAPFGKGALASGVDAKPVAKLFVICCKCQFWHDLPSKLYEAMALPLELHKADQGKVAGARLETAVKCPWCEHAMTTRCCQGWTTVVYMHERHH